MTAQPLDCDTCNRTIGKYAPHVVTYDGRVLCVRCHADEPDTDAVGCSREGARARLTPGRHA